LDVFVSSDISFVFNPNSYPYSVLYRGAYRFKKHYYKEVGDLKEQGEEFECARFLDELPEVEVWVRNLERSHNYSFWLQTSSDKFYPDFVCKLEDGRYLKHWFLAVAQAIDPPKGIASDEPWVHVDVDQQTLVLYRGKTPIFATLVSTGLPAHETPEGIFTIRSKHLAETMANLGPDAGDDSYRVEDVPWTQYFDGSLALHGAFWHDRFGLKRSHGCVNLSPRDAHYVFEHTWPHVEAGWHGASTDKTGLRGSKVVVTR
jgi:hypothetical protein